MNTSFNPMLMKLARWKLNEQLQKRAFVPQGATDPSAGGGMAGAMAGAGGGDPSGGAGGGMPPDPSMMGAAGGDPSAGMAPDPSAGGGAMPPPSAPSPDISETIRSVIQQELANAGMGAGKGGASGKGGAGPVKASLETVGMDIYQVKKILTYLLNLWQIPLPPDVLDGPNRDPSSGMPVAPGTPGSTSDPAQQSAPPPNSAIKPIQSMQPAMPSPGGSEKQSADALFKLGDDHHPSFTAIKNRAAALNKLAQSLRLKKEAV